MDEQQRQAFERELERRRREAEERSHERGDLPPERPEHGSVNAGEDPRARNSRHGKVTADKWNQ